MIFIQYNFKEGATTCNFNISPGVKFHSRISYNKFKELAEKNSNSKKKIFGDAFKALNARKRINKSIKHFTYELSTDKKYLKVTSKHNDKFLYKIEDNNLTFVKKCKFSGENFTTIKKEGFGEEISDLIEITSKDFEDFIENPLFDLTSSDIGYSFMTDPTNCNSLNISFYGNNKVVNQSCPNKTGVFENLKTKLATIDVSSSAYLCTASTEPTNYLIGKEKYPYNWYIQGSDSFKNQDNPPSPSILVENVPNNKTLLTKDRQGNQLLYAANYILKTKLQTDIANDPYDEFEVAHENLQDFANNVINILSGNSENKIYGWIGPSS
jgi:hypothetical protein